MAFFVNIVYVSFLIDKGVYQNSFAKLFDLWGYYYDAYTVDQIECCTTNVTTAARTTIVSDMSIGTRYTPFFKLISEKQEPLKPKLFI